MRQGVLDSRSINMADTPGARRVLLIDDDVKDLEYLFRILETEGHEVIRCTNYGLGAKLVGAGDFDFIIVSQGGRNFEGRGVIERAKELDPRPPLLVVARSVEMHFYLEEMRLGAADYLEKPVPPMEMKRVISSMCGVGSLPGP